MEERKGEKTTVLANPVTSSKSSSFRSLSGMPIGQKKRKKKTANDKENSKTKQKNAAKKQCASRASLSSCFRFHLFKKEYKLELRRNV